MVIQDKSLIESEAFFKKPCLIESHEEIRIPPEEVFSVFEHDKSKTFTIRIKHMFFI